MEDGGEKFKRVGSQDLSRERGRGEGTSSGGSLPPLLQATAKLGEANLWWSHDLLMPTQKCSLRLSHPLLPQQLIPGLWSWSTVPRGIVLKLICMPGHHPIV